MQEMSEKQAIKILNFWKALIQANDKDKNRFAMAIATILELYQQEKEKNKSYNTAYNSGKAFEKHRCQDKIKAKIKELEQTRKKHMEYSYEILYAIDRLKELLEGDVNEKNKRIIASLYNEIDKQKK